MEDELGFVFRDIKVKFVLDRTGLLKHDHPLFSVHQVHHVGVGILDRDNFIEVAVKSAVVDDLSHPVEMRRLTLKSLQNLRGD